MGTNGCLVCAVVILGIAAMVGAIYIVRYGMLKNSLKSASKQMEEIRQNPEDNRILLVAHANRNVEKFLEECNEYIATNQKLRIEYANRERKLRRQIEAISHDLRTPLTAIRGYLELLDPEVFDEDTKESLEVVQRKTGNLQQLISNFYDLSRLELDDYRLELQPMELSRCVRENLLLFYDRVEERGLEMRVDCETPVQIQGDEVALGRVIGNMIQNALRYAESYFAVSVGTEGNQAYIVFENDTVVVNEQDVEHLFERFYMSDAARSGQGTGLGLTISKLLVEAMGGNAQALLVQGALQIRYTFPLLLEK